MVVQVDVLCEAIVATGLTTTLTVNVGPLQLPGGEVGVTLYTAVAAAAVVLVSASFNMLWPDAAPPLPVMLLPVGVLQAYVVPVGIVPVGV